MRKSSLYILSAILLFILCGIMLTNSFEAARQKAAAEQKETVTREISFIHWAYFPDEVFSLFEQDNPGVKINYTRYIKGGYSEMQRMLLLSGEKADVMGVLNDDYIRLASDGTLADLTGQALLNYYEDDVRQGVRHLYDGKEYAVALRRSYYGVWYNKIFFERYGIDEPQDYGDLLRACAVLQNNHINPIVIGARDEDSAAMLLLLSLFSLMDEPSWENRYVLGMRDLTEDAGELLGRTQDLIDQGYLDPESISLTAQQAFEYFKQGNAAMIITSDQSLSLTGDDMEKVCDPGVFRIPYSIDADEMVTPAVFAQDLIGIHSGTDVEEDARRFLEFLSRPDIARIICEATSAYPTVKNVDTGYLRYSGLWDPLRSGECVSVDLFSLSAEKRALLLDDCQLFLIGSIDSQRMAEDIRNCMIVQY